MANPTPFAVAAMRSEVSDWSPPDDEIAAALNTPSRANPTPQSIVPASLSVLTLMAHLDPAEARLVMAQPWIIDFRDAVERGDRARVKSWAMAALATGLVSEASYAAVIAEVDETTPDPDYRPLISWAELTIGRAVDLRDIEAARAAGE